MKKDVNFLINDLNINYKNEIIYNKPDLILTKSENEHLCTTSCKQDGYIGYKYCDTNTYSWFTNIYNNDRCVLIYTKHQI